MKESVHYENSIKFRLNYENKIQELAMQECCFRFYNDVYLVEPNKPIHSYPQRDGGRISVIKNTDHCYSIWYRSEKDLS